MDGSMWSAQQAHFADRYQVVLVDPPGHGRSEPLTDLFTFDECAHCVTQILDGIGAERAHFVGNSWGGMIGGTLAAHYPSRVISAVLMNCTGSPAPRPVAETKAMADAIPGARFGVLAETAHLAGLENPDEVNALIDEFLGG